MANDYECGWLRGFFDGEGGAYFSRYGKKKQLTYSVGAFGTSEELFRYASKCLARLQIRHKIYVTKNSGTKCGHIYQLRINTVEALNKFHALIGFTEGRKQAVLCDILTWINRKNVPRHRSARTGQFIPNSNADKITLHYARQHSPDNIRRFDA